MTLRSLHLRNLILVEKATIAFQPGLTVISGETGSGKSAILEAIQLLLGARSDTQLIRQGAEQASAEAEIVLGRLIIRSSPLLPIAVFKSMTNRCSS